MQNLQNQIFGNLLVESYDREKHKWLCLCSCGEKHYASTGHLNAGSIVSCGHYGRLKTKERSTTHGMTNTKVFRAWSSMRDRILNTNNRKYPLYGGRGIKVCDRWLHSFENFYTDVGDSPTPKHTLDRIDSNGDYEPKNVRWATYTEQNNNRSLNNLVSFNGKTKTIAQWSKQYGLLWETLKARLSNGWSVEKALTTRVRI